MTTPTTYSVELSPVEARLIEYALNALEAIYGGLNDKWPDPATAAQVNRVRVLQQKLAAVEIDADLLGLAGESS